MKPYKVLVAYDGSEPAKRAIEVMRGISEHSPETEVILVHVMRLFSSGAAAAGIDTVVMDDAPDIRSELDEVAASLPSKVDIQILKGSSPADLILNCAQEKGADLIVMGSRGMGGVKGFLGSVSYAVVKESPITVMIAKDAEGR